jgi:ATPase family associated with various cellular activities (AAA)
VVDARTGEVEAAIDLGRALVNNLERVVFGSEEAVSTATVAALAGGHLLIEDVPGVGKSVLAGALATSLGADLSRVQGHPDLLPSDITGVSVFAPATGSWEFRRGPVFAGVVLVDELNRTTSPPDCATSRGCRSPRSLSGSARWSPSCASGNGVPPPGQPVSPAAWSERGTGPAVPAVGARRCPNTRAPSTNWRRAGRTPGPAWPGRSTPVRTATAIRRRHGNANCSHKPSGPGCAERRLGSSRPA